MLINVLANQLFRVTRIYTSLSTTTMHSKQHDDVHIEEEKMTFEEWNYVCRAFYMNYISTLHIISSPRSSRVRYPAAQSFIMQSLHPPLDTHTLNTRVRESSVDTTCMFETLSYTINQWLQIPLGKTNLKQSVVDIKHQFADMICRTCFSNSIRFANRLSIILNQVYPSKPCGKQNTNNHYNRPLDHIIYIFTFPCPSSLRVASIAAPNAGSAYPQAPKKWKYTQPIPSFLHWYSIPLAPFSLTCTATLSPSVMQTK